MMTPVLVLISRVKVAYAGWLRARADAILDGELQFWERRVREGR